MTQPCPGVPAELAAAIPMPGDDSLHIDLAAPMRCPECDGTFTRWWLRRDALVHWSVTTGELVLPAGARNRLARQWWIDDNWRDSKAAEKWDTGKVPEAAWRHHLAIADRALAIALGEG